MAANLRPVCIVFAVLNVSAYLYIFFHELPKSESMGSRPLEGPLSVRVPPSIAQSTDIVVSREVCPHPVVRVRLVGPEIYAFPPLRVGTDATLSKDAFTFEVDIQKLKLLVGAYKVEVSLLQCHSSKEDGDIAKSIDTSINCTVATEWNNMLNIRSEESTDDSRWAWVPHQTDYVFTEIDKVTNSPVLDNLITLKDGTTISKPRTLLNAADNPQSVLKYFSELSNYELVCWMGDADAQRYYQAFMQLFPLLGSQRPFKFKYLPLNDVSDPTKDFSETMHQTFDKCKIFFISYSTERVDAGISATTYGQEVATLLDHIEKSHSDATFVQTWLLSQRSVASASDTRTHCHESTALHRTPDRIHEFNEEARRTMHAHQSVHVHFMDVSDISEPLWPTAGGDPNKLDSQVASAVAMRCLEKIAETVKMWRSINQIGTQRGLVKNGTLIPNDELYKHPYKWGK